MTSMFSRVYWGRRPILFWWLSRAHVDSHFQFPNIIVATVETWVEHIIILLEYIVKAFSDVLFNIRFGTTLLLLE